MSASSPAPAPFSPAGSLGAIERVESAFILPGDDEIDVHFAAAKLKQGRALRRVLPESVGALRAPPSSSSASRYHPHHRSLSPLSHTAPRARRNAPDGAERRLFSEDTASPPPPDGAAVASPQKTDGVDTTATTEHAAAAAAAEQLRRAAARRERDEKRRQDSAAAFVACLPGDEGPALLERLRAMERVHSTEAFSTIKSKSAASTTAVPVCFYPHCRDAVKLLLGEESDAGTFPRSLLSPSLTMRLGVTVSAHVPQSFRAQPEAAETIDHASFRAKQADRGGFAGQFASMTVREIQKQHHVTPHPQQHHHDSDDDDDDATDLSRIRLSNLPSGAELENSFDATLRDGIRRAAISVMRRILGPRLMFLVHRQRRKLTAPSTLLRTHSLAAVHQMVVELLRSRASSCSPLAFALHQSRAAERDDAPAAASPARKSFGAIANSVAQSALSQKASGAAASSVLGLQFPMSADFSSTSGSGVGAAGAAAAPAAAAQVSIPALASNYQAAQSPQAGFFAAGGLVSLEALHGMLHSGTLLVVPPNVQLSYQGAPVSTRAAPSSAGSGGGKPAADGAAALRTASVIVLLQGTVSATVQAVLPAGDAGLFISKQQYEIIAPAAESGIKTVMSLLGSKSNSMHNIIKESGAGGNAVAAQFEAAAAARRAAAFESFFQTKVPNTADGGGSLAVASATSSAGAASGASPPGSISAAVGTNALLATTHFNSHCYYARGGVNGGNAGSRGSAPVFPLGPLLARPRRADEVAVDRFHNSGSSHGSGSGNAGAGASGPGALARSVSNVASLRRAANRGTSPPNTNNGGDDGHDGLSNSARQALNSITFLDRRKQRNNSSNNSKQQQLNNAAAAGGGGGGNNKRTTFLRTVLSAGTALGPFGLPVSLSAMQCCAPYPVSLRTKARCELFVIPHAALIDCLRRCVPPPHSSFSPSMSPERSDGEKILIASLAHTFALSFFSALSSRTLARIPWLRRTCSSELRAAVASAFRPVLLLPQLDGCGSSGASAMHSFRSALVVARSTKSGALVGTIGDFLLGAAHGAGAGGGGAGGGGVEDKKSKRKGGAGGGRDAVGDASEEGGGGLSGAVSLDPLAVVVAPQFGVARCLVSLSESSTSAEPSVVSVECLAGGDAAEEYAQRVYGSPTMMQHRLRDGGVECGAEGFAVGLREVFVTAGRRLDAAGDFRDPLAASAGASTAGIAAVCHPATHVRVFAGSRQALADEAEAAAALFAASSSPQRHQHQHQHHHHRPVGAQQPLTPSPSGDGFGAQHRQSSAITGPVLVFVLTAADLQRQVSLALKAPAAASSAAAAHGVSGAGVGHVSFNSAAAAAAESDRAQREHALEAARRLRAEAKALFAEADSRLVRYRTSAMSTTIHLANNDDDGGGGGADNANDGQRGGGSKKLRPQRKSVHELLTTALARFPLVAPLCAMVDRGDLLEVLALLFEFKKYRPGELVVSATELAADRVIVLLRGKVALQGSVAPPEPQHGAEDDSGDERGDNRAVAAAASAHHYWRQLTFANAAVVALPVKWACSAVAVSDSVTAEANRALVLAFLQDVGLLPAMRKLAAVVMCRGISQVHNFDVPRIVAVGASIVADQPALHPTLPPVDAARLLNPLSIEPTSKTALQAMASSSAQLPNFGSRQERAAAEQERRRLQEHREFMEYVGSKRLNTNKAPVFSASRAERAAAQHALQQSRKKALEEAGGIGGAGSGGGGMGGEIVISDFVTPEQQAALDAAEKRKKFDAMLREKQNRSVTSSSSKQQQQHHHHEPPHRQQPTRDAEELLRAKGVILPSEYFLASSLDPARSRDDRRVGTAPVPSSAQQQQPSQAQRKPPSTLLDIHVTHKNLSAGLWCRKFKPTATASKF